MNQQNLTVMDYHNKAGKPVGDGELVRENNRLNQPLLLKKIVDYCTPQYCLSCAYFQQTKGNFGRCTVLQKETRFDGSKKGTGCRAWRLHKSLYDVEFQSRLNKQKEQRKTWIQKLREAYNKQAKEEWRIKIENRKKSKVIPDELQIPFNPLYHKGEFIHRLPFTQTSDIHVKRGYYKHRFNKHVIDFAITQIANDDISLNQISKNIKKIFAVKVSRGTIMDWQRKFCPNKRKPMGRKHDSEWKKRISEGVRRQADRRSKESAEAQG